jgi:hypothetical protein
MIRSVCTIALIRERCDGLVVGTTILRSGGEAKTNETDNNEPGG